MTIEVDGDHLAVNAGCNSLSAAYSWTDNTLQWVGDPAATMMACDPKLQAQDDWITGLLTQGLTATLDGDQLTLESEALDDGSRRALRSVRGAARA